jgi:signal peptidase I
LILKKIREAKKTLTNVVLGVLFALFALFIFQFFAVQVLRIPGFN